MPCLEDTDAARSLVAEALLELERETADVEEDAATEHADAEVANEKETLPWALTFPLVGVATDPATGQPLRFSDVPRCVRDALHPVMLRLFLQEYDPLTNEMLFANVSRYYGRPILRPGIKCKGLTKEERLAARDLTRKQWNSWQVQRMVPGTRHYQGRYSESVLAALVNAASIVDARLTTAESALAWLVWIRTHAEEWLRDPLVACGLCAGAFYTPPTTRRKRNDDQTAEDAALLAAGWTPPQAVYLSRDDAA